MWHGLGDPESWLNAGQVLLKIVIGVLLAGAIGWEREVHRRPAGMRTHIMLMLGVVLIAEASKAFGNGDPARIAAQIVTGVGFLGAGAILRMGLEIKGLTSAASLWATTGIGLAISVGGYFLAVAVSVTILALFTLAVLAKVEKRLLPSSHPIDLFLSCHSRTALAGLCEELAAKGHQVLSLKVLRSEPHTEALLSLQSIHPDTLKLCAQSQGIIEARWVED